MMDMTWMLTVGCSGPGAMATIQTNEFIALACWASVIAMALLGTGLRLLRWLPGSMAVVLWGLVVVHPRMAMDARSGDCGYSLRDASLVWSALAAGCLLAGAIWAIRQARIAAALATPDTEASYSRDPDTD